MSETRSKPMGEPHAGPKLCCLIAYETAHHGTLKMPICQWGDETTRTSTIANGDEWTRAYVLASTWHPPLLAPLRQCQNCLQALKRRLNAFAPIWAKEVARL